MQEVEVDIGHVEPVEARVEGAQCTLVAVVADPQLGLHPELGALDPAAADPFPDLALIEVRCRGVDGTVAGGNRGLDGGGRLLRRTLEDAEPESGHVLAVVQGEDRA